MLARRQFLVIMAGQLIPTSLIANTSVTINRYRSQQLHRDIIKAFHPHLNDPHIRTAMWVARKNISFSAQIPWQELVTMCSNCKHTEDPRVILAGFKRKKKISLAKFKAWNVNGYMLTKEELILGQLLTTA